MDPTPNRGGANPPNRYASVLWWLPILPAILVLDFFLGVYLYAGKTTAYGDGLTKLNNARRVFDNPTGTISLAQLGSIWLVGSTALTSALAWITPLYRTGLAGSIWSMLAYAVLVFVVYDLTLELTNGNKIAGMVAIAGVININLIYFATTPMTESLLMAAQTSAAWSLVKISRRPGHLGWLLAGSILLGVAAMMRYETWFYTALSLVPMAIVLYLQDRRMWYWLARVTCLYATTAFVILYWILGWEWVILGSPLYFADSRYSAHAIDVVGAGKTFAVGHWRTSIREYGMAVGLNVPRAVFIAAAVGAAVVLVRLVQRQWSMLALTYLAGPVVFFPLSLYLGQNAIDIVPGVLNSLNIRYGTTIVPFIAILAGLSVAWCLENRRHFKSATHILAIFLILVVALSQSAQLRQPMQAAVLQDVAAQPSANLNSYASWLGQHYDYGRILAESFGPLNGVQFRAHINLGDYITESDPVLWRQILANPATRVEWVLVRNGDMLDTELVKTPQFQSQFRLVYANGFGRIYLTINHEARK